MTPSDREELSELFGIPVFSRERYKEAFYVSPAFEGLVSWVRANRSTALRLSVFSPEFPQWYAYAIAA